MPYTDWIPFVEQTIPEKTKLKLFEFGLGEGTKYLLESFKDVFSFELADSDSWYIDTIRSLSAMPNWRYEMAPFYHYDFYDYIPQIPDLLRNKINSLFREKFDVVFMDGGYHNRGQIANYVLNTFKPKYLIIHDINFAFKEDMYDQIVVPDGYDYLDYNEGEGTRIYRLL